MRRVKGGRQRGSGLFEGRWCAARGVFTGAVLALGVAGAAAAPAAPPDEVAVWAAASLREVAREIARAFEAAHAGARVALSFGASNVLARQIEAGAPADVFLSADEASVDALAAARLVRPRTRVVFASNQLVVIEADGLAPPLRSPDDLARPGLRRIALAAPQVPAGKYAREWLARRGLLDAVAGRVIDQEDVRATLAAVDSGSADAGIVYATDARVAKRAQIAFTVPDGEQPRIVYVAVGVAGRPGSHTTLADAFLGHLHGPEAQRTLRAAGFSPAPASGAAAGGAP